MNASARKNRTDRNLWHACFGADYLKAMEPKHSFNNASTRQGPAMCRHCFGDGIDPDTQTRCDHCGGVGFG